MRTLRIELIVWVWEMEEFVLGDKIPKQISYRVLMILHVMLGMEDVIEWRNTDLIAYLVRTRCNWFMWNMLREEKLFWLLICFVMDRQICKGTWTVCNCLRYVCVSGFASLIEYFVYSLPTFSLCFVLLINFSIQSTKV